MKVQELQNLFDQYGIQYSISNGDRSKIGAYEFSQASFRDSEVIEDGLFVAIEGISFDGHTALASVLAKKPSVIVVNFLKWKLLADSLKNQLGNTLVIQVQNTRQVQAVVAAFLALYPSRDLHLFGVTGTNGKTSCTYMFEWAFDRLDIPTGVIGTINHHLREKTWPTEMTTPGPQELQARISEMKEAGARAIAMEVSSHALDQYRCDALDFSTVLFTNLTRDHLDYHKTMQNYFDSKQRLFTDLLRRSHKPLKMAIVNIDDPWGQKMRIDNSAAVWTYGSRADADFKFKIHKQDFSGMDIEIFAPWGSEKMMIPVCGIHNAMNITGVVASICSFGIMMNRVGPGFVGFTGVPGRLQRVVTSQDLNVFVDYAHTPDALENTLKTLVDLRNQNKDTSKIHLVFGCGGDRDAGKRPLMAQIAEKYADHVIVTSDNPRTEDPEKIIAQINAGFTSSGLAQVHGVVDRKLAIQKAISEAKSGDVVLIAGKGHEDYQIIGKEKIQFDDYQVAKLFL